MSEIYIKLVDPGETKEEDVIGKPIIATRDSCGRDEFNAAGARGLKASGKLTVWDSEYHGESEVIVGGERFAIYRDYGPRSDQKHELYYGERSGTI